MDDVVVTWWVCVNSLWQLLTPPVGVNRHCVFVFAPCFAYEDATSGMTSDYARPATPAALCMSVLLPLYTRIRFDLQRTLVRGVGARSHNTHVPWGTRWAWPTCKTLCGCPTAAHSVHCHCWMFSTSITVPWRHVVRVDGFMTSSTDNSPEIWNRCDTENETSLIYWPNH